MIILPGGGGDPQHWAEKAQGLLDWLKTFFYQFSYDNSVGSC